MQNEILLASAGDGLFDQFPVIQITQLRWALLTCRWRKIGSRAEHEIEMTFDEHDLAALVVGINSSGSITDEKCLYAQLIHHVNGERGEVDRVALVKMKTPLHGDDVSTGEATANELSPVTGLPCFWGRMEFVRRGESGRQRFRRQPVQRRFPKQYRKRG